MTTPRAVALLQGVLVLVGVYALAMIALGDLVNDLFDVLGFGAEGNGVPAGEARDYALLLQGVLGSVIVGWVVLLLGVVRVGLARDPAGPWWLVVATSLATWFVLDTGFSLVVGHWEHALFNVAFALALLPPLSALRPR